MLVYVSPCFPASCVFVLEVGSTEMQIEAGPGPGLVWVHFFGLIVVGMGRPGGEVSRPPRPHTELNL